jgi:hypothetical protein
MSASSSSSSSSSAYDGDEAVVADPTAGMNPTQLRLFNLRMRINQGRKANETEVQNEFKRITDPKFEHRQRQAEQHQIEGIGGGGGDDGRGKGGVGASKTAKKKDDADDEDWSLHMTVEASERRQQKLALKEKNLQTFGMQALVSDRQYKTYENELAKLPASRGGGGSGGGGVAAGSSDALAYGQGAVAVSAEGRARLSAHVAEVEEKRRQHSRRRTSLEAADVDYINGRNEAFNKKVKKSFDKYTVEIRQNLERGTAL